MIRRWSALAAMLLGAAFLLLLLGAPSRAAQESPNARHFTTVERAMARQSGFVPPPLTLAPGTVPGGWAPVTLPARFKAEKGAPADAVNSAWFRAPLSFTPSAEPVYVYVPRMQAMGHIAIYADGRLIYAPQTTAKWNGFNLPHWAEAAASGSPKPREILVSVQATAERGFALSSFWVGDRSAIEGRYAWRHFLQIDAPRWGCVIFMVIGFLTLFLWLRRRQEPAYILIFAVASLQTLHSTEYGVGSGPLPISDNLFQWMESNSEFWYGATVFIMVSFYVGLSPVARRLALAGAALFTAWTTALVLLRQPLEAQLPVIWFLGLTLMVVTCTATWAGYLRRRSRIGLLFAIFNSLSFPAALVDIAMAYFHLSSEGVFMMPYLPVLQAALFIYILIDRHLAALGEAEALRRDLFVKLKDRETELSATYERLRDSEHRQTLARERQRLMRDMHDGVGSSLIGALAVVERGGADPDETARILRECLDDLKLAIDSLEPGGGDPILLLATARYRLEPRLEQAGLRLRWSVEDLPATPTMTPEQALHLLRIVQEVFTNIVKHAQARQVSLSVSAGDEAMVIAITDDGKGFDTTATLPPHARGRGRGLANLRTRAAALGGEIAWTSEPGSTRVELRLPLVPKTSASRVETASFR